MDNSIIYFPSNIDHMHYFIELFKSYNGIELSEKKNIKINIYVNFIPKNINKNRLIYLFNTEQCSRKLHYNRYYRILKKYKNIILVDYSMQNIRLLKQNKRILYLPYQYNDEEINYLKKLINTSYEYDVAFCPVNGPRRTMIYKQLLDKGVKVVDVRGWLGSNRDHLIAKSKILINIHCRDNYNIYESLRCDRWIFAKKIIVSETSLEYNKLDISNLVIFEKYDRIIDKIITILHNYDKYYNEFIIKYNDNIDNIINNRKKYNNIVLEHMHKYNK